MIRAVVTDMDNTLYSWVDYIVPSIEAMVASLCQTTGFPRIRVVQALKEVYERYESNEYPFAIQESNLYAAYNYDFGSFENLVIRPAAEAFSAARRRYLKPYPGVLSGLTRLRGMGVKVAALTDAPRNPAERRVLRMGLDGVLDGIYTLPKFPFPPTGIADDIKRREEAGGVKLRCPVVELPREFEKPDARGLRRVLEDLGVEPHEALVVGDSQTKDIRVAREVGCIDAWAEYGTYKSEEYSERLSVISAPSATRRHLQHAPGALKPTHRLSNFELVADIVEASVRSAETKAG